MGREIEIKLALDDPPRLRGRLAALGAAHEGAVFEINTIFDTRAGRMRAAEKALRLREVRLLDRDTLLRATLTFKQPAEGPYAGVKVREEHEMVVSDPAVAATILGGLGFEPVIIYEKVRETWQLPDAQVLIDEMPRLAWFVEVEGASEQAVRSAAAALGIDPSRAVHESYIALTARDGDLIGSRRELRFRAGPAIK